MFKSIPKTAFPEPLKHSKDFITEAERLVLEHVSEEKFGVSELADALHMSRSNLLRKVKKETELSASQFIRQVRLQRGMELLQTGSLRVSEVSDEVGFGSVSYFIKCFREQYGYPPGEVGKRVEEEPDESEVVEQQEEPAEEPRIEPKLTFPWKIILAASVVLVVVLNVLLRPSDQEPTIELNKSIAVLPFKNESADSSNLYFVNGLMQSTLSNLQKIQDLRVISRTSSENYRNSRKSIPEIAEELNVLYVVEGSGQRVGDQVLLNIQLIDALGDRPIWSQQYNRKVTDIFNLQNEVAQEITKAIQAIVTPGELEILAKKPTENLEAYDLYLQALGPFHTRSKEGLEIAIPLFEQAIEHDEEFALAYANIAIAYYFLDLFQAEKQHTEKINSYSDKALLYDSKSDVSLISKALYYIHTKDYRLALPHLEKALEYNPNSSAVVQMLSDFYARQVPNTAKYLNYALKGIQLDVLGKDSIAQSYGYLQLSNALMQTGFFDEALLFVNKSLDYDPNNYFAPHLKIFVRFAQEENFQQTEQRLIREWKKDTTRLDLLQDIGKLFYSHQQWDSAYYYFRKFTRARETANLDIYPNDNAMIAMVYQKNGFEQEAEAYFNSYIDYCERDESIYKCVNQTFRYAYEQEEDLALEQLELFAEEGDFQYWFLLLENDPMLEPLRNRPEFKRLMQKIKERFWADHQKLRNTLEEEGLL